MNGNSNVRKSGTPLRKTDVRQSWQGLFDPKRKFTAETEPDESPTKYIAIENATDSDETDFEEDSSSTGPTCPKTVIPNKVAAKLNVGKTADESECDQIEIVTYDSDENSDIDYRDNDKAVRISNDKDSDPGSPLCDGSRITEFPTPTKDTPVASVEEVNEEEVEALPLSPIISHHASNEAAIIEYHSPEKSLESPPLEDDDDGDNDEEGLIADEDDDIGVGLSNRRICHDGIRFQSVATMPVFNVEDAVTLSLVVLRCSSLGDGGGTLPGPMVWTLCYDTLYECQRYVILTEKANKKIKPGICIRLYSPWLLSSLPTINQKVIHSVDLYQILIPGMLSLSGEKVKAILSTSNISYADFIKSMPGECATQVFNVLPQLKYQPNTVRKQVAAYREKLIIDGMIWIVFDLSETLQVIVQDCDYIFTVIEIPKSLIVPDISTGSFCRFSNLLHGGRVTEHSYTPLFSVLRTLGSNQDSYHKLYWTINTTLDNLGLNSTPIPLPEIKHIRLNLPDLQSVHADGRRVATRGIITLVTKSELYLSDRSCQVRILLLNSFNLKNLLKPSDVGKIADIFFLRLSDGAIGSCAMDQYTLLTVSPLEQPSQEEAIPDSEAESQ